MKNLNSKLQLIVAFILSIFLLQIPLVLLSQDTIPAPPAGFDTYKADVPHGKTEVVSYYSSTVGIERKTRVYFPPNYSKDSSYNVLYLLHGIGGDINEWLNSGAPVNILDNLYSKGNIAPMIVVLPNGRAMVDDSPGSDIFAADKVAGFANFEFELLADLIPFIDSAYPIKPSSQARAIAGLSMGGGQALDFGLAHLDTFAWVGAFSPAPNTYAADQLIPNITEDTSKLSGLWISCGDADGLFYITQNTHNFMVDNNIDHYFLVEPGKGHDWSVWKPGLYHFAQRIFGAVPVIDSIAENTTSNSNKPNDSEIRIAYNPSNRTLTVVDNANIKSISIYDINGRLKIYNSNVENNTLNISELNNGVYLMIVSDGKQNINGKVVVY